MEDLGDAELSDDLGFSGVMGGLAVVFTALGVGFGCTGLVLLVCCAAGTVADALTALAGEVFSAADAGASVVSITAAGA